MLTRAARMFIILSSSNYAAPPLRNETHEYGTHACTHISATMSAVRSHSRTQIVRGSVTRAREPGLGKKFN